jgi:chromosomal replication initiation ATPase DnaA
VIQAQVTAREIRQRLMNPTGGRASSHLEIVSEPELRRQRLAQVEALLEARKAQKDFERREAIAAALRQALEERAHVMAIARVIAEEEAPRPPNLTTILRAVAKYYGVHTLDVCSARRHVGIVLPRHVVMYLGRECTLCSLPQIGARIGRRDHTTVLHGHRKIKAMIEAGDVRLAADIDNIKWELGIR